MEAADLCLLVVPDRAVPEVAQDVAKDLKPSAALIHCAGALTLSAFGSDPAILARPRGSFHPLSAVSDPTDPLARHAVALSSNRPLLLRTLKAMAADLALIPFEVPEESRLLYHAAAVLSAAGVVALASAASQALNEAGIEPEVGLAALLPLMRSAIRGIEQRGLSAALTGPIARGDVDVVRAHLAALPRDLLGVYRILGLRSLELARPSLPMETQKAFETLLGGLS
jgi:predicted short-subunit dehydrogenase-like oxidoreductase (DUF2520 family)